jgi:hypothetical protein
MGIATASRVQTRRTLAVFGFRGERNRQDVLKQRCEGPHLSDRGGLENSRTSKSNAARSFFKLRAT